MPEADRPRFDGEQQRRSDEPLRALRPPPDRHRPADDRRRPRRHRRLLRAAGLAPAAGRLPDDLGQRAAARGQPRDDGDERGDAARAASRHDLRRQRDDLVEPGRQRPHQPAVRPVARHRRRGARGAGGDQRLARRPAGHAALEPDLPQGQPVRRAGDHPGADLADADAGADLRHGVEHRQPAAGPGRGRRRRRDRRQHAAGGAGRAAAVRPQPLRHQRRGRARRDPGLERQPAEGRDRERGPAAADLHPDAGAPRRRLRADGRRLAQRRGGAPFGRGRGRSTGSRTTAPSASSTAGRR